MDSITVEEDTEQFSGDELEDSEVDGRQESPPEKKSEPDKRGFKLKMRPVILIAAGLFLLAGLGSFWLLNQGQETGRLFRFSIRKDQLVRFNLFIIPYHNNNQFTYLSLDVSFKLPDKKLRLEMLEKREKLRGIIYEIMRHEINRVNQYPSLKKLKQIIVKGVNEVISNGKIHEIFVTDVLAV